MTLSEPEAAVELELSDWPESTQRGRKHVCQTAPDSGSGYRRFHLIRDTSLGVILIV
jgi:hypothetical protein